MAAIKFMKLQVLTCSVEAHTGLEFTSFFNRCVLSIIIDIKPGNFFAFKLVYLDPAAKGRKAYCDRFEIFSFVNRFGSNI